LKGKKPMNTARAFHSHPEPELLKIHDPKSTAARPATRQWPRHHQREKAHGNYEHWLWPLFSPGNYESGCQIATRDMVVVTNDIGWTLTEQGSLRQRGCTGCHRYEGYDKEARGPALQRAADQATRSREEGQFQASWRLE